ncbi:hypothetical protein ERJ75_001062300 [Trypanosoma vivax]|nr:hypothetical protein ERJ75_001062300 [Trypanosoma vivax]
MTLYNITIHPLRLVAHLCKQGSVYVVLISRKGVDVMTKPSICAIPGEVDFSTPAELNQTKTFQLNFSSPKDRRMVQFAMYDITNHRHSVKLNVFEIPLAGMCSVLAQESICEKKAVSFRISDRPGRLEVIFRMHPVTAPVPPLKVLPPPWSAEERGNKTGDGGASENLTRLPQHVLDALKKAEMLPRDVNAVELDANIAQEITVRASLLFPTDAALRNRIQTLETEIAKFEYDAQFAAKDSVSFGSAAWNALRAELAHWEDLAKQLDAISAHQAGITSLIPSMHSTDDGDRALIADLESQLATAQAEMRSLETQENDGEVSGKLISLIDQVEQLEELLNGLRVAAPLAARKSELLGSDSSHVDQWGRLAGDLYDKESAVEQLTHTILLLNQIQTDPYRPGVEWNNTDAGPSELAFVRDNKRRLTNLPPEMRSVVGTAPPMMPATSLQCQPHHQ